MPVEHVVRRGRESWKQLKNGLSWEKWLETGDAMFAGHVEAMRERFGGDLSVPLLGVDRRYEVKVRGYGFIQLYGWLEGGADLLIVRPLTAERRW